MLHTLCTAGTPGGWPRAPTWTRPRPSCTTRWCPPASCRSSTTPHRARSCARSWKPRTASCARSCNVTSTTPNTEKSSTTTRAWPSLSWCRAATTRCFRSRASISFLDESTGDVAFCEFNGDGSSGMNENREITHSVEQTATFKEFAKRHHVEACELFDAGAAAVSPSPETCEALSHDATVKRNRRVRQRAAAGRHAHRRRTLGRTLMAGGGLVLAALCALGAWAAMRCAR